MDLIIEDFREEYQDEVKKIILKGMEEHWGELDFSLNPDLNNIKEEYRDNIFLTGFLGRKLVATGALKKIDTTTFEVVRMSVSKYYRRRGYAASILNELIKRGVNLGCRDLVLETTESWKGVVSFYLNQGFVEIKRENGDIYFHKRLF